MRTRVDAKHVPDDFRESGVRRTRADGCGRVGRVRENVQRVSEGHRSAEDIQLQGQHHVQSAIDPGEDHVVAKERLVETVLAVVEHAGARLLDELKGDADEIVRAGIAIRIDGHVAIDHAGPD